MGYFKDISYEVPFGRSTRQFGETADGEKSTA